MGGIGLLFSNVWGCLVLEKSGGGLNALRTFLHFNLNGNRWGEVKWEGGFKSHLSPSSEKLFCCRYVCYAKYLTTISLVNSKPFCFSAVLSFFYHLCPRSILHCYRTAASEAGLVFQSPSLIGANLLHPLPWALLALWLVRMGALYAWWVHWVTGKERSEEQTQHTNPAVSGQHDIHPHHCLK